MTAIAAAPAASGDYPPAAASGADRAIGVSTADAPPLSGLSTARTAGPAVAVDRSPAVTPAGRTVRSWPLLVLAAPAAAEVWSGRVGIAQKTGFGLVSPLPGIWPALHLDTSITLPVRVEAYAVYRGREEKPAAAACQGQGPALAAGTGRQHHPRHRARPHRDRTLKAAHVSRLDFPHARQAIKITRQRQDVPPDRVRRHQPDQR